MSRTKEIITAEQAQLLTEELKGKDGRVVFNEKALGVDYEIELEGVKVTFYNPKQGKVSVYPQGKDYQVFDEALKKVTGSEIGTEEADKSAEDHQAVKRYIKGEKYNEFGADEVGKEVFGPFIACVVYYDDEFNQDIFDERLIDSKEKRIKNNLDKYAEMLIDPKNKLKYALVAMTDLDDMNPFMQTDNGELLRVDATYKFNDIRKHVGNMNNVQAILMNEAIRILVERHPKVIDNINESTFDSFFGEKQYPESKNAYYDYLKGEDPETLNVHVEQVMEETHGIKTKIIENVVPTRGADEIENSPSAAASIIASYYKKVFFENTKKEFTVKDDQGTEIYMPTGDSPKQGVIDYGKCFIKKYGIEKFNKITKKRRIDDTYYNIIINESIEENLLSDEDESKIRKD